MCRDTRRINFHRSIPFSRNQVPSPPQLDTERAHIPWKSLQLVQTDPSRKQLSRSNPSKNPRPTLVILILEDGCNSRGEDDPFPRCKFVRRDIVSVQPLRGVDFEKCKNVPGFVFARDQIRKRRRLANWISHSRMAERWMQSKERGWLTLFATQVILLFPFASPFFLPFRIEMMRCKKFFDSSRRRKLWNSHNGKIGYFNIRI